MKQEYIYNATVTKVYDGDTITVDFDLGFFVSMRDQTLRLYGIDTPELRGVEREQGLVVRDWLREKILGKKVVIKSYRDKKGKYGRWLADVYLEGEHINTTLLEKGYAEVFSS